MEPKLAANVGLSRDTQTDIDRFAGPLKSSLGESAQIAEYERLHATQTVQDETRRSSFRNRSQMDGAQANVEVRAEHDRAKSAADDAAVFVPQCLACGYELTGLADGACPECGTEFSHEALRVERDERLTKPFADLSPVRSLGSVLIAIQIGITVGLSWGAQHLASVLWPISVIVLIMNRERMLRGRLATSMMISGAAALVTLSFNPGPWTVYGVGAWSFLARVFGWSAMFCSAALIYGRWRWVLWAWASLLIGMGVAVGVTGLVGMLRGEHWGVWSRLGTGAALSTRPMSNPDSVMLGAMAIVVGLLVMLLVRRIEPFTMEDPQADRRAS